MKWGTYFYHQGMIAHPVVRDAMDVVKREDFLPPEQQSFADEDHPIAIGYGQTNSQPYTVAFMLNLLDPRPAQKILDIGSGSGWTSVLLARIVSQTGTMQRLSQSGAQASGIVYAVERIPELVAFARANAEKYGFVESGVLLFIHSDGSLGLPEHAPFHRILVSAAFQQFPNRLLEQLVDGGVLVVPVDKPERGIVKAVKQGKNVLKQFFPGFVFVPMVSNQ